MAHNVCSKPPLRLPSGTHFRFGKRNGANSLTVCRNLEYHSPMQRVSVGLLLVRCRCPEADVLRQVDLASERN